MIISLEFDYFQMIAFNTFVSAGVNWCDLDVCKSPVGVFFLFVAIFFKNVNTTQETVSLLYILIYNISKLLKVTNKWQKSYLNVRSKKNGIKNYDIGNGNQNDSWVFNR